MPGLCNSFCYTEFFILYSTLCVCLQLFTDEWKEMNVEIITGWQGKSRVCEILQWEIV